MPLTPSRLAQIVTAADQPIAGNPEAERYRGMLGELIDELALRDEMLALQYKRIACNEDTRNIADDARWARREIKNEIAILHNGRSR